MTKATTIQSRLLADGRGRWARRFAELMGAHVADLATDPSAAQASILRRAAVIELALEDMEVRMAAGDTSDGVLDAYVKASGGLRRLLESVGLDRQPKDIGTTLEAYLATATASPTCAIEHPLPDLPDPPAERTGELATGSTTEEA